MAITADENIIRILVNVLYFIGLYLTIFWLSIIILNPKDNTKKRVRNWPTVSIIIPMYNEQDTAEQTIRSVYELDYPKEKLEIYCVNDGSTDNTLKILKKLNKEFNFHLLTQKNQGKYAALNNALGKIDTEYFSCLDADSFVEKSSLKKIMEEFDSKDIKSVMPIMKVYQPENLIQRLQWFEYIISVYYKYIMGKLDCIHVVPGPFGTYETKTVKELGGFRKAHLTEDLEMALRLQDKHYKLKQCLDATVYTKTPPNLKALVKQRVRWYQGTLLNVADYKHMLLNKRFEDFGVFHLPSVALGGFFLFLGVIAALYLTIKTTFNTIKRWYLTDFDFMTYLTSYQFEINLLDWNWQNIFSLTVLLVLLYVFVYLAFAGNKERLSIFRSIKYSLMFLYYFIVYRFIIAYIWLIITYKLIFRKANKWEKVN